jgi:N-acetylglucosaminyldiphosphoundecaprenol N-acetyl-beta-D-mannosaminyltransferase
MPFEGGGNLKAMATQADRPDQSKPKPVPNGVERDRVEVLGVGVDRVTMASALQRIDAMIADGGVHLVVTADSSGLHAQLTDPELHEIMASASLVTPDSFGVVWAAKRAGKPVSGRVSGVDLLDEICALSAQKGHRLFFLGAAPGVAELAAERLRLRHPGCNIVGTRHGYFPASDDEVVAEEVALARPDVLFVAMGIPRQEKFIYRTKGIIRAKVAIGVGGSLDVFSGRTKRAPMLIQKLNLEWLWRLLLNPKKASKVKSLPRFVSAVLRGAKPESSSQG